MPDVHITFELLEAAERGVLRQEELFDLFVSHLRSLCGACDVEIQAYLDEVEDETARARGVEEADLPVKAISDSRQAEPVGIEALDDPVERFLAGPAGRGLSPETTESFRTVLHGVLERLRRDEEGERRDVRDLVRLVEADRADEAVRKVTRARTRFRSLGLGHALLDEVRASLPDRPGRALGLARAAEQVAVRMRGAVAGRRGALDFLAAAVGGLALAHEGNALRVLDRLADADIAFSHARWVLDDGQISAPEILAEVDALEGSLRRAQRRFGKSESLLRRAAAHWAAAEDALGLARALLKLGSLYFQMGRPSEALVHEEAVLRALPPDAPPHLRLCAEHNRLDSLCELGYFEIAAELLVEARRLYEEHAHPRTLLRLAWVEGKIALGLGDAEHARERLESARSGFLAAEAVYDAALISLDLAQLHLEEARAAEARTLAAETVALFRALELPREAMMALAQLDRAVREDSSATLSAAILATTAKALRLAAG